MTEAVYSDNAAGAVKAEAAKTVETVRTEDAGTEAVSCKEEPKRTGYWSEIDGIEVDFELQYRDQETDMKDIARRVTEDYVINNSYEGKIPLF